MFNKPVTISEHEAISTKSNNIKKERGKWCLSPRLQLILRPNYIAILQIILPIYFCFVYLYQLGFPLLVPQIFWILDSWFKQSFYNPTSHDNIAFLKDLPPKNHILKLSSALSVISSCSLHLLGMNSTFHLKEPGFSRKR